MNITLLDGAIESTPGSWDSYLSEVTAELEKNDHIVNRFILKDLDLHHCIGCWDCWVKTPGQCVFDDDSRQINHAIIHSDLVLFATPLVMGFATHELKRKMDRMIPLVHPYLLIEGGETHHRARYEKYPLFGLLMDLAEDDTEINLQTVTQIFQRTARNIKSRLAFSVTTDEAPAALAARIEDAENVQLPFEPLMRAGEKEDVGPVKHLTIFNGSPRGKRSNSLIMLDKIREGFLYAGGKTATGHHLSQTKKKTQFVQAFKDAECVLVGFPLYTDGMPGPVMEFFAELEGLKGNPDNPPLAFLVHSGFPEALHSRFVEQYLISLAEKLNSPYLGTIVRGGSEGIRIQPENMNKKFFAHLTIAGGELASIGTLSDETIAACSRLERNSPLRSRILRNVYKLPVSQFYWNNQLKQNNAFEKRFAAPYRD